MRLRAHDAGRRARRVDVHFVCMLGFVAGCGRIGFGVHTRSDAGFDAALDGARDSGLPDARDDAPSTDAGFDASFDAGLDASIDAGLDAASDAGELDAGPPPIPPPPTGRLSIGNYTGHLLTEDGRLFVWGKNDDGELGIGVTSSASAAVDQGVFSPGEVVASYAGGYNAAVRTVSGAVYGWGRNQFEEITAPAGIVTMPTEIDSMRDAIDLGVGNYHLCALFADGRIECRGSNNLGQCGNGAFTPAAGQAPVALPARAVDLVTHGHHNCAVLEDTRVACWGWNVHGELGLGTMTNVATPTVISTALGTIASVVVGNDTVGLVLEDRRIAFAGSNTSGLFGNGDMAGSSLFVLGGSGANRFASLEVGGAHACVIATDGDLLCAGSNFLSSLGRDTMGAFGTTFAPLDTPVGPVEELGVGSAHACTLSVAGEVDCWGSNLFGQLGDGRSGGQSLTPRRQAGLP